MVDPTSFVAGLMFGSLSVFMVIGSFYTAKCRKCRDLELWKETSSNSRWLEEADRKVEENHRLNTENQKLRNALYAAISQRDRYMKFYDDWSLAKANHENEDRIRADRAVYGTPQKTERRFKPEKIEQEVLQSFEIPSEEVIQEQRYTDFDEDDQILEEFEIIELDEPESDPLPEKSEIEEISVGFNNLYDAPKVPEKKGNRFQSRDGRTRDQKQHYAYMARLRGDSWVSICRELQVGESTAQRLYREGRGHCNKLIGGKDMVDVSDGCMTIKVPKIYIGDNGTWSFDQTFSANTTSLEEAI